MCVNQPIWKLRKEWISEDYSIHWLSGNTHPKAIEIIRNRNKNNIHWFKVSANPSAFDFQMENFEHINWRGICDNHDPRACELIMKNQDKIYWPYLSSNPNAIELLEANMNKVDMYELYRNPKAIPLIKKLSNNKKKKWSKYIGLNQCEQAIPLIMSNIRIFRREDNMHYITSNPFAIDIIIDNLDYMTDRGWDELALNPHPEAIELLKNHCPTKPFLYNLILNPNPNAFELLDIYKEEILKQDYLRNRFYENPIIFDMDYVQMKEKNKGFEEELLAYVMEPTRVFNNGGFPYLNELF